MRDSFIFYKTFYDCIKELPQKSAVILYNAIFEYVFNETEPKLKGLEQGIFNMMRAQIDANNKRYENGKKGAEHGKLGGRPKKENPKGDITESEKENPKKTPNVNVNENVNVNDIKTISNDIVCPELKKNSEPPVVEIALNDKSLYPIFTEDVEEWQVLYPAIDVLQELRKMKGWCDANPKNRKTKSGVKRFVNSWLSRAQDKAPKVRGEVKSCESESSVRLW